ncbi:MAG: SDR family NAD(P)-dependent oxidoreductase, partial [Clostridia bacterium]|nr:SDR family NAD(P)-dependent oxidoreductase [Clostridia bacterium]
MTNLAGKVAIVTGSAQGLGRTFCLALAREGATVACVGHRNMAGAEATAKEIEAGGGRAMVVQADVSSEEATLAMAKVVAERFGRIDILVNNAAFYANISRRPFNE